MPSIVHGIKMGKQPFLLVIHQAEKKIGVAEYLLTKDAIRCEVSSHFAYSSKYNDFVQMVPIDTIAHHAGISSYNGRKHCNVFSIGIELPGPYEDYIPQEIVDKLYKLTELILINSNITDVCGHKHIAPKRRRDPNDTFDFITYANHFKLKFNPKV